MSTTTETLAGRRDTVLRYADNAVKQQAGLKALDAFDREYPERDGRNDGVICTMRSGTTVYCYRTKTQRVAEIQPSSENQTSEQNQ